MSIGLLRFIALCLILLSTLGVSLRRKVYPFKKNWPGFRTALRLAEEAFFTELSP